MVRRPLRVRSREVAPGSGARTEQRSEALGVGLIGCGRIAGLFHLPVLAAIPDTRLAALADTDPGRLSAAGTRVPAAKRFKDYRDLLAEADVAAVIVCLPPALHAEAAVAAFDAGKHVYLEKPIATEAAAAEAIVAAWRRAGTVGMIGFNFRVNPAFMALRRRLAAGEIGEVVAARATFCSVRRELPAWKRAPVTGGGALRDLGAHHLDLVPYLLSSPVVRVAGVERSQCTAADSVFLHLELASGVPVEVFLSLSSGINANRVEVFGTAGALTASPSDALPNPVQRADGRQARLIRLGRALAALHPKRLLQAPGAEPSFAAALSRFAGAARTGQAVRPDLADGRRCLALVAAAERAIGSGQTVAVEAPAVAGRAPRPAPAGAGP